MCCCILQHTVYERQGRRDPPCTVVTLNDRTPSHRFITYQTVPHTQLNLVLALSHKVITLALSLSVDARGLALSSTLAHTHHSRPALPRGPRTTAPTSADRTLPRTVITSRIIRVPHTQLSHRTLPEYHTHNYHVAHDQSITHTVITSRTTRVSHMPEDACHWQVSAGVGAADSA
jgi:hypothetical protein